MNGIHCMDQIARNNNIKNNKENALRYIEGTPNIEFEDEKDFLEILINQIKYDTNMPYVERSTFEKEYVYKRVESIKRENTDSTVASLLDEFDNALCLFIANGLLEVTNKKFDKLYVNEEQLKRVENYYFQDNGKSYTKGPKK